MKFKKTHALPNEAKNSNEFSYFINDNHEVLIKIPMDKEKSCDEGESTQKRKLYKLKLITYEERTCEFANL